MANSRRSDDPDALILQGLRTTHAAVAREFDLQVSKQQSLERRIAALQQEHAELDARAGRLGLLLAQLEDAIDAAAKGRPGKQDVTDSPARLSRHGPAGIRAPILEIMATRREELWSPEEVRRQLTLRGIVKTGRNVGQTMRNMLKDGQLERDGHAAYRLPSK